MAPTKTRKTAPAPAPEPAPEPAPPPTPEAVVETSEPVDRFAAAADGILGVIASLKAIHVGIKTLQREHARTARRAAARKAPAAAGGARGSGFTAPALISDTLAAFLGAPPGATMPRVEVTRRISAYVKEHALHDESDRRIIRPDARLFSILSPSASDAPLTYFTLQSRIKHHFSKAPAPPGSA